MKNLRFVILLPLLLVSFPLLANTYGLKKGTKAPTFIAKDIYNKSIDSRQLTKSGPTVLVFYRGGWCPYCNTQLQRLQKKVAEPLKTAGAHLIAISVDKIAEGTKSQKQHNLDFTIISDPEASILKKFNVAYTVPDNLVRKYLSKNIDLEKSSGRKHHIIAVPAVYVIDSQGMIRYAHVDSNYKKRAPAEDIIAAVQKIAHQSGS